MSDRRRVVWISLLIGAILIAGLGPFVVETGSTAPDPVPFDDTVAMGITPEEQLEEPDRVDLPKAQVFYSQYRYVVGYHGIDRFVDTRRQAGHERRFGYPLAVYVTDYSDTSVDLSDEGYPSADGPVGWTDAETATYVVESDARTLHGDAVLPFSSRSDAEAYASSHGGTLLTWQELLEYPFEIDDATTVRERVDEKLAAADDLVADSRTVLERPTSVVVGEDVATIQEAVDTAPAETTVVVPDGTYEELVEIDRPITLAGEGNVTIRGDDESTVVQVTAERAAVTNVRITGVGNTTRAEDDESIEGQDTVLEMAYGRGDAGIEIDDGPRVLVEDVAIETPANGILIRDSPETVVRNVTVDGGDEWTDAYMGVMTMRSEDGVVENSRFRDGRDGIYTHRSHGLVYRNNTLERNRIGVHLMYTSRTVIADNEIRDARATGIHVMTNPEQNAVVGNDVRNGPQGIRTGGWNSYFARNVVANNDLGMTTEAGNSIYEDNVIANNEEGLRASHILPTNRVVGNDFVGNDRHATAREGPLRIWTRDGAGNFWHGAFGESDGEVLDRSYAPTGPTDRRLHRVDGTPTLARAPLLDALSGLEGTAPGMRTGSIVDLAPLCEPSNPDLLESVEWSGLERDCDAAQSIDR